MATIRKRDNRWQVQVRRQGRKAVNRTFSNKADAEMWARRTEIALERIDIGRSHDQLRQTRLADLLERYMNEVTPKKRNCKVES